MRLTAGRLTGGRRLALAAIAAFVAAPALTVIPAPAAAEPLSGKRLFGFVMGRSFRYEVSEYVEAQLWFATPVRMRTRVETDGPRKYAETWHTWQVRGPLLCLIGGGATNCFRLTRRVRRVKGKRVTDAVAVFTGDSSRYIWRRCVQSGRDVPIACRVLY